MSYRRALARGQVWGLLHDIDQGPPAFLAPGTDFMEDNFSTDLGGGWFQDDLSALHLLCTLFLLSLHQLHLRSPGIRSQKWETPDLEEREAFSTC